jgi:hypothetical protein
MEDNIKVELNAKILEYGLVAVDVDTYYSLW